MTTKTRIIIACVLVLLFIPFSMWWFSEERAVKRRSDHLIDVMTIDAESRGVFRQLKAYSLGGVLADQIELESSTVEKVNGSYPKDQIESAFSWICQNSKESIFEITEFREVKIEGDRAIVRATVEGFIEVKGGRPVDGSSDVTLFWVKSDGNWVLTKMIWN
jgi:hypothetical protein